MTTSKAVRIMSAAHVLRGLRADTEMRCLLNRMADAIMQAVVNDNLVAIAKARLVLSNVRTNLKVAGGLDDLILSNALEGVVELLMPV